jgi:hypothetical protein
MHIEIEAPRGELPDPGQPVRVRINGGEWQESIVQPAEHGGRFDHPQRFTMSRQLQES